MIIDRMKPGSIILIDNVLWSGKVIHDAHPNDRETLVMKELNSVVTIDNRVENILLPIRDGLMAIRKI
jgi:caffeoyl-CoA O-methyltransferase